MKSLVSTLLQRSTLMVASFILAISSLSAAMPLFLSQNANAVGGVELYVDKATATPGPECTLAEPCMTISEALTKAANFDTINVSNGTYAENLAINKSVTIIGQSASSTIIKASAAGDIVTIDGGVNVEISNLSVSGPLTGLDKGIYVKGGSIASLHDMTIIDIKDSPMTGAQRGIGIQVGRMSDSTTGTATINNVTVSGYQKNGIVVGNTGSFATITNSTITGSGPLPLGMPAQNGVQVSDGAKAVVTGNTITGNYYSPMTWNSVGILLYDDGGTVVSDNIVTGNLSGLVMTTSTSLSTINLTGIDGGVFGNYAYTDSSWPTPSTTYVDSILPVVTTDNVGTLVTESGETHALGYDAFPTMQEAVNAVATGGTVNMNSDVSVDQQISINQPVTIEGNNKTISATFDKPNCTVVPSCTSNDSVVGVNSNDVTINNLTVNGANHNVHGVDTYKITGLSLDKVTVKNNGRSGLNVNGSEVTVKDITTTDNGWHGIDVDQGSGVTTPATLTVNGTSAHSGESGGDIFVDDSTKAVSVVDTNSQYDITSYGNARVYKLKMAAPTNLRWLNHTGDTLGAFTKVNQVTPAWTAPVAGGVVDHYEYSYTSPTNSSWSTPSSFTGTSIPDQAFGGAGNNGVQGQWQFRVRTVGQTGNMSPWVESPVITYDKIAPTIPNITNPLDGAFFKTAPILNQWSASTEVLSGFSHYQIAYNYDDGHSFGGSTCAGLTMSGHSGFIGCRDLTATSRNHTPGLSEQGGVTIWVRSFDNAGNASDWSTPVHYTYDATLPSTTITNVAVSNGVSKIATINGVATDTNFNYYYCYVTGSGGEVGVRDSLCQTAWAAGTPFKTAFAPTVTGQSGGLIGSVDMSGLATGTYTAHLVAIDKAGNQSEATSTFDVDNTAPAAAITTTGTQSTATPTISGTVDADADTLVFTIDGIVQPITWTAGDTTWTSTPTTALADGTHSMSIVATDGAGNQGGQAGTITISVPVTLLTAAPGGTTPTPQATVTPGEVLGDQTTNEDIAKTGDNKTNQSPSILGDATTNNPMNLFGLAWYWWLAILAAIIAIWWIIAAALRRRDQGNA